MSQPRWRLAHCRRSRWCTKISLEHRAVLRELYHAARKSRVMVGTARWHPMQRISWAFNLELDRNVLARIILSKYQSLLGVEIHSNVEILSKVHCVTHVIKAISTWQRHARASLTMSNVTPDKFCGIVWTARPEKKKTAQKVVSTDGIRMNLAPICPFNWPTTLTSDEPIHSKLHEMYSQGHSATKSIPTASRNWSYMFQNQVLRKSIMVVQFYFSLTHWRRDKIVAIS